MIGQTILHYKIVAKLGSGGMGVVYKAEDTRLERIVALKFLSSHAIAGEEEKKRFKREAKAAAALNHPNICHIYAIDEADDRLFIAMEFIEGKSLHEMISANGGSPLPLSDAVNYATQIAAGLQAAHEKGITHRDIKSANVMVTPKDRGKLGVVKIMDFGLAKLSNRSMMTKEGTTLGTAAYMSPEQARGEIVDHRTDIWSLGVVLYEMISARLPFRGEYEQAMVYSILNEEPEPFTALRSNVPIALDGIIAKALAKDPATRYQHVDELPADLKGLDLPASGISRSARSVHSHSRGMRQPSLSGSQIPKRIAFSLMAFLAIASFIIAWFLKPQPTAPPQKVHRLSIAPPQGAHITRDFNISPDGNLLAYIAKDEKDYRIYLRSLDKIQATPLAGTEGVRRIFFSPDSRWLGFLAGNELKKISTTGGSPITICTIASWDFDGASWGNDGRIIFGMANSGLLRVPAEGGNPEPVSQRDAEKGERHHGSPIILPGGRYALFNIATNDRENRQIAILSLETKEHRVLLEQGGFLEGYIPTGQIVYRRTGGLMVVPFDLEKLEITGSPVRVEEDIAYAKVGSDGTLFYFPSTVQIQQKLVWVDRKGKPSPLLEESGIIRWPRISPDGKKVAFGFQGDIWIYDTVRQTRSRLTTEGGW
jgi:serine/threonine protein kinase